MCDKSKDAPPHHQRLKGGQPHSAHAYVKMCACMCVCVCVCDNLFFVFYPGYYIVLVLIYSRLEHLGKSVLA